MDDRIKSANRALEVLKITQFEFGNVCADNLILSDASLEDIELTVHEFQPQIIFTHSNL